MTCNQLTSYAEEIGVIRYLYQLVRLALRLEHQWTLDRRDTLNIQFKLEFNWDAECLTDEDPCECYWLGDAADPTDCVSTCKEASTQAGILQHGSGIKARVEKLEALYWPLRIWQRQHPVITNWRYRLYGEGFPGVPEEQKIGGHMFPNEGEGWQGWGAETGDVGSWREENRHDYEVHSAC